MNTRERFRGTMRYQAVDRAPNIEVGAWPQAVTRWREEGLPQETELEESCLTLNGNAFFDLDPQLCISLSVGMIPGFEPEVIE